MEIEKKTAAAITTPCDEESVAPKTFEFATANHETIQKMIADHDLKDFKHIDLSPYLITREHHFIWRLLKGTGRFEEAEVFYNETIHEVVGVFSFGGEITGHDGVVHGGALATIMDEIFGYLAHQGEGKWFTANLSMNYRRPVLSNSCCTVRASVEKQEGRK
eukprot:Ihof_evm8s128 gene=Ihof_evmTU8s128